MELIAPLRQLRACVAVIFGEPITAQKFCDATLRRDCRVVVSCSMKFD